MYKCQIMFISHLYGNISDVQKKKKKNNVIKALHIHLPATLVSFCSLTITEVFIYWCSLFPWLERRGEKPLRPARSLPCGGSGEMVSVFSPNQESPFISFISQVATWALPGTP